MILKGTELACTIFGSYFTDFPVKPSELCYFTVRHNKTNYMVLFLSEEEREAEMDVGFFVQETLVVCLQLPETLLVDVCLISWGVQIEAINGKGILPVSRHLMLCKIALNQFHYIIDSTEYSMKCNLSTVA